MDSDEKRFSPDDKPSKVLFSEADGVVRGEPVCAYCARHAEDLFYTHPGGVIVACPRCAQDTYHFSYMGRINAPESQATVKRLQMAAAHAGT